MDHEIDTTFALQNFCIEKSQMYSQNVTFRAEISGNHRFSDSHTLEVEGLRALGKGLTGPKNSPGYALLKHSPISQAHCLRLQIKINALYEVSSRDVKAPSRPQPKFR